MAIIIFGMFLLGVWMVELEYYDRWYHDAPYIHKSLGILLLLMLFFRLFWRWFNVQPKLMGKTWERFVALSVHRLHYLPPETWKGLLGQMKRNGYQAAYANIHSPEWVIETPAKHGDFTLRVPLWKRVLRFPMNMLKSLLQGKWVWVLSEACYAWGFLRGWLKEHK